MRVLVTGSNGLIGRHLMPHLRKAGHEVVAMVRREARGPAEVSWNPADGKLDPLIINGADAIVHLAGRNVFDKRWNESFKRELTSSRVDSTRVLADAMARCAAPPKVFISAGAVGYYGSRGDEVLTETSAPGRGFLAELCQAWEAASEPIAAMTRRCVMRIGVVLTPAGGALGKMLTPFKLGLGGRVGSGAQFVPWISLPDILAVIEHLRGDSQAAGTFNATAPNPVTNAEFTQALARALHRPAVIPMPGFAARLAFGEVADEALLASDRAVPQKLLERGFAFRHTQIDATLADLLI